MPDTEHTFCACGDEATLVCTHCHEANCIDCMTDSGALCRDCDADEDPCDCPGCAKGERCWQDTRMTLDDAINTPSESGHGWMLDGMMPLGLRALDAPTQMRLEVA